MLLMFLTTNSGWGSVVITDLQQATDALSYAFGSYSLAHGGKLPSHWSTLDQFLIKRQKSMPQGTLGRSRLFSTVDNCLGLPLEEGFTILTSEEVRMAADPLHPDRSSARVLSIMNIPVDRLKARIRGRYLVWQTLNGQCGFSFLPEAEVIELFANAGVKLPALAAKVETQRSPDDDLKDYSSRHFKNPSAPTKEELAAMAVYFAGNEKPIPPDAELPKFAKDKGSGRNVGRTDGALASGRWWFPALGVLAMAVAAIWIIRRFNKHA